MGRPFGDDHCPFRTTICLRLDSLLGPRGKSKLNMKKYMPRFQLSWCLG